MAKKYAAALDQGTTGTRFMIFDDKGQPVSAAYEEHQQIYPQPGWVEHDLMEIWEKTQKVDGGAVKNNYLMQLQANILGEETTALGAAYAAGLATGFWESLDDLRANWGIDRVFKPQWDEARRDEGYAGWKRGVERARGWVQ